MQNEVLMLAWRMMDFAAGTLYLDPGMTKNDDGRIVYLTPGVSRMLHQQQVLVNLLECQSGLIIPWVFPHLEGRFRG
jgi:hypothetical protein